MAEETKTEMEWIPVCCHSEDLDLKMGTGYFMDLAKKMACGRFTDFIFLDHQIDPLPILQALQAFVGIGVLDFRFSFHIYGDFTLFPQRWLDVAKILRGAKTKFLCASERQRKLVSFFEKKGRSVSTVCPFPVHTRRFQFSQKNRAEVRKKLRLTEDQTLLLYTGRLSLQKNITRLIDEFCNLETKNPECRLALAGPYDDIAGLTSGIEVPPGFYFHQLRETLEGLPLKLREKIFFLGDLDHENLKKVYSAGDLFVSLSLYHDEDFGMCPAEALSSGLPVILTDWGGYGAFKIGSLPCELVPVHMLTRGLALDGAVLKSLMKEGIRKRFSFNDRRRFGLEFEKNFGIKAVAKKLDGLLRPESFQEGADFDWALETYCKEGILKGGLYSDVYERYVESPSH
jgi:glycosyltransferase involved in cell wall biosynthesis